MYIIKDIYFAKNNDVILNKLIKVLNIIKSNFSYLTNHQIQQFNSLTKLYEYWNNKINVISRKDISELNIRHVLHSLSISKVIKFLPKQKFLMLVLEEDSQVYHWQLCFQKFRFILLIQLERKLK